MVWNKQVQERFEGQLYVIHHCKTLRFSLGGAKMGGVRHQHTRGAAKDEPSGERVREG